MRFRAFVLGGNGVLKRAPRKVSKYNALFGKDAILNCEFGTAMTVSFRPTARCFALNPKSRNSNWPKWRRLVRARNIITPLKHRPGLTAEKHGERNVPARWEENVSATLLSSPGFAYWSSSASTQKQPSDISWGRICKHKFTIQHSDLPPLRSSVI